MTKNAEPEGRREPERTSPPDLGEKERLPWGQEMHPEKLRSQFQVAGSQVQDVETISDHTSACKAS